MAWYDEIRKINGIVYIWNGKEWVPQSEYTKLVTA